MSPFIAAEILTTLSLKEWKTPKQVSKEMTEKWRREGRKGFFAWLLRRDEYLEFPQQEASRYLKRLFDKGFIAQRKTAHSGTEEGGWASYEYLSKGGRTPHTTQQAWDPIQVAPDFQDGYPAV